MKISYLASAITAVAFAFFAMAAQAVSVPVDLNTWTEESYPAVSGFGAGNWTVSGAGDSVLQSVNGQPTLFYSDFDSQGSSFTGNIRVNSNSDDDYIGFALGFNPGDTTNAAADYLLIDWKRTDQPFNFGSPSNTPGSTADRGLAVSRVTGLPTADEFWGHTDLGGGPGKLEELQRGNNLFDTGWAVGVDYEFTFDFGPNNLDVYVDSILELSIVGNFNNGRFAFYNFSQSNVTYSGFVEDAGSFPAVPIPAAAWLFGTALIGLLGFNKRTKAA